MNAIAIMTKAPEKTNNGETPLIEDSQLQAHWLWSQETQGPQTRMLRRRFSWQAEADSATLHIFAVGRYHLWVNGQYITRGPAPHHPHRPYCDVIDLTDAVTTGENLLAILTHSHGRSVHAQVQDGPPGLCAHLKIRSNQTVIDIGTDDTWKITAETGWLNNGPARNWALGEVETFDANRFPQGWTDLEYDDSHWDTPDLSAPPTPDAWPVLQHAAPLPGLRHDAVTFKNFLGAWQTTGETFNLSVDTKSGDYGGFLFEAERSPLQSVRVVNQTADGATDIAIEGLTPDTGVILDFDLGAAYTGVIQFICESQSSGTIDVGWAESLDGGRPTVSQHGASYADRVIARPGVTQWQPHEFLISRYISLQFRGFEGPVTLRRVGMLTSEPDLNYTATFESGDPELDAIWSICERSIRVGTQENLMDCPSREQANYCGDGHPIGRWLAMLSGDARQWRYLVEEQFARQADNGLIRTPIFTGADGTLIDQLLIAVLWSGRYMRQTGDQETVARVLQPLRNLMDWYRRQFNEQGLLEWPTSPAEVRPWETQFDPARFPSLKEGVRVFIDHPGMGWHSKNEPGIDRRGCNTAINALLVMTLRETALIEKAIGDPEKSQQATQAANDLVSRMREAFFDEGQGLFADGVLDGEQLDNFSQQTNAWALLAGVLDAKTKREVLSKMVPVQPGHALGGPYFWIYIYPLLVQNQMHELALAETRRLWTSMLDGQSTTLWETFTGDHHDSRCHPWSASPLEFLSCDIAGLPTWGDEPPTLRPRCDLLPTMNASICHPAGPFTIAWRTLPQGAVEMSGHCPTQAVIVTPPKFRKVKQEKVAGDWKIRLEKTG